MIKTSVSTRNTEKKNKLDGNFQNNLYIKFCM